MLNRRADGGRSAARASTIFDVVAALDAVALVALANGFFMRHGGALLQHYDEGYVLALARRMLEGGRWLPYVDGVSHRGPLYYFVVALVVKVFGFGTWMPVRVLALASMLLTVVLGTAACWLAGRRIAGSVMALGYLTLCLTSRGEGPAGYGLAFNSEHLVDVFAMAALLAAVVATRHRDRPPSLGWVALCGAAVMGSTLCKQVGLVYVAPFGLWFAAAALERKALPARERWRPLLAFVAGLALPLLLVLARYAIAGELRTLYYWAVEYNARVYVPAAGGKNLRAMLLGHVDLLLVLLPLAGWGALRLLRRGAAGRFDQAVVLGTALSVVAAGSALRDFPHYAVQWFPWVPLLGGVALERLALRDAARAPARSGLLARLALVAPLLVVSDVVCALELADWRDDPEIARAFATRDWPVCRFLQKHTAPGDSIFVWGFDPAPYTACDRRPASRFVFTTFLAGVVPWVDTPRAVEEARVVPGSRETLLDDLRREQPAVIFDSAVTLMNHSMMDYPALRDFVEAGYCRDPLYAPKVWTRKAAGECPPGAGDQAAGRRPLTRYWNATRHDCFSTATDEGMRFADLSGYVKQAVEGSVLSSPQAGTKPLELYYDELHGDNLTTTSRETAEAALASGYRFVRIEGYVFAREQPGTAPLELYYEPRRHDYCTCATPEGAGFVRGAGYDLVRVEGYVPKTNDLLDAR